MNDVIIQGIEDKLKLHEICLEIAEEYCDMMIIGTDLYYSIVNNIDYRLLSTVSYMFINECYFRILKNKVYDEYKKYKKT